MTLVLFIVGVLYGILLLSTGRLKSFIALTAATIPLRGLYIYFITSLELWKALSLIFLFSKGVLVLSNVKRNGVIALLFVFIFYSILTAGILNVVYTFYGFSLVRIFFQSVYYISIILVVSEIFHRKDSEFLVSFVKYFLIFAWFASSFGVVQYFVFQFFGYDISPIRGMDYDLRSSYTLGQFRVNSICGEPKHNAILSVLALSMIWLGPARKARYKLLFTMLLVSNLFLTFSSTGIALLGLLFAIKILAGAKSQLRIYLPVILGLYFFSKVRVPSVWLKQINRIGLEVQDQSVVDALVDKPIIQFFGAGLGGMNQFAKGYLPREFYFFAETYYKPNSGFLYIISDFGIIGLLSILLCTLAYMFKSEYKSFITFLLLMFLVRYTEIFYFLIPILFVYEKDRGSFI